VSTGTDYLPSGPRREAGYGRCVTDAGLLERVETFYDAVPRDRAHVEEYGGLVLFVPDGRTGVFYGRPNPAGAPVTGADIAALRARQRELGLPEALEWVHELNQDLTGLAEPAGLAVLRAPLMVLDPAGLHELPADGRGVRLLAPDDDTLADDLAACDAVAATGFSAPGTIVGEAGPAARDAARVPLSPERLAAETARLAAGASARALAETVQHGVVACGQYQRVGDVVEIVGVSTLPAARRRGLGSAVTAALARRALDDGAAVVFLSAAEEAVSRIYARLGFRRIATACIAEPARRGSHPGR
jgi:ribosomal protein S18 acetylase RimI-like enzyme